LSEQLLTATELPTPYTTPYCTGYLSIHSRELLHTPTDRQTIEGAGISRMSIVYLCFGLLLGTELHELTKPTPSNPSGMYLPEAYGVSYDHATRLLEAQRSKLSSKPSAVHPAPAFTYGAAIVTSLYKGHDSLDNKPSCRDLSAIVHESGLLVRTWLLLMSVTPMLTWWGSFLSSSFCANDYRTPSRTRAVYLPRTPNQ
jgi:predicted DCC family thiol-disulfide oxidoreductase YuxK